MNKKGLNWLGRAIMTGLVLAIIGLGVWFIQNGIANKPQLGYKFDSCPSEINIATLASEQSASLGIYNSGNTDASLILHFSGENISILNKTKTPYISIIGNNVDVYFVANKGMSQYDFSTKIYYSINNTVDGFSYSYIVNKNEQKSISGTINKYFGEITGFYPNKCSYKKTNQYQFTLTNQ